MPRPVNEALEDAISSLDAVQLRDVIRAYDEYLDTIQRNERMQEGWFPVRLDIFIADAWFDNWRARKYKRLPENPTREQQIDRILRDDTHSYWPGFGRLRGEE